jgi:hypothetical protein
MRLRTLIRLWLWTTLMAVAALAVLIVIDGRLKAATGFGTVDLQKLSSGAAFNAVFGAWIARQHAAAAGFALGFDYLFMPLYAMAFYFAAILAREAFAPRRGAMRRLIDYLGFVPLIGALADAVENALEYSMLAGGADDATAYMAFVATNVKWSCITVGMVLLVAGIAGVVKLRLPKKEEEA